MIFDCHFSRKGDDYTINISGWDIECKKEADKTDFKAVFDYILKKLEEFVDKSRYE
ncbi:Uncharacterised protein [Serratia fonticola]|uniref:Uncharacterized protein n=1 Tax=Serratia fonticola TaxID=47917 RepID=A0A448SNZ5_SERFO|nr:Uncharacterised protein [Serratia fonticola]